MSAFTDHRAPRRLFATPARHLSRDESETIARKVLGFSTADEARVTISSGTRGNTRFAVNQVSTAGDDFDAVVTVRSVFGRKVGSATTNKLDDASLRAVVERAEALARLSPEDPELMPELGPQQYGESRSWSDDTSASIRPLAGLRQVSRGCRPGVHGRRAVQYEREHVSRGQRRCGYREVHSSSTLTVRPFRGIVT